MKPGQYFEAPDLTVNDKVVRFSYGVILNVHEDFSGGLASVFILCKSDVGLSPSASPDTYSLSDIKILSKEEYETIVEQILSREVVEE